jgi:hypothetical protein
MGGGVAYKINIPRKTPRDLCASFRRFCQGGFA